MINYIDLDKKVEEAKAAAAEVENSKKDFAKQEFYDNIIDSLECLRQNLHNIEVDIRKLIIELEELNE